MPMTERTADPLVCARCGGANIEARAWIDPNTNAVISADNDDGETRCRDCEDHGGIEPASEYAAARAADQPKEDDMHVKTFKVSGAGPFPLDMLRYDSCAPADEADSSAIERSFNPGRDDGGRYEVTLRRISHDRSWRPSAERWRSFGWDVE